MDPTQTRLGELLLEEGKVTAQQLARALRAQSQLGGRIGTNLVELNMLSVLDLGRALSKRRGVPEAHPDEFVAASPRLLNLFPRELAARLWVFPLRVQDRVLRLAMVDPQNVDQIAEVTFVTGLRVTPVVSPELRMVFFLEQRFGIPRPGRFSHSSFLAEAPSRSQTGPLPRTATGPPRLDPTGPVYLHSRRDAQALAVAAPASMRAPTRSPPALEPDDPDLVYLDAVTSSPSLPVEDDFEVTIELDDESGGAAEGAGGGLEGIDAVREALATAQDRSAVAAMAVRPVLATAALSVLFRIKDGLASAVTAAPSSLPPIEVQRLELPLNSGSLLERAVAAGGLVRGSAAGDPLQKVISAYLRAPDPGEVCVLPLVVAGRAVGLLCVQLPTGGVFGEPELAKLSRLSVAIAQAYLRLIRDKKGRSAG